MEIQYPYEKLGLMYLGREIQTTSESTPPPLLYKNKNLTTHGVIIGMTGSGKTGLGIGVIEEAIMDNVPSIIIDPKGDMANLMLSFPECKAEDFKPWLDPADAARKELSIDQYAEQTADSWRKGLASWHQPLSRIAAMKEKTEMTVYTPGSTSGVPLSVLSSFKAPAADVATDTDTLNSLVNATTNSLLALVDITGDPLKSREHILISSLFLHYWRSGIDISLETLISLIVNPPFDKVGVFPLDTFYPQTDRMTLAMTLNNILASPSFGAWTQGESFDIQRILYTKSGKPRTAIFSIAHLSETERMFFVTMLLNQFIGWMRRQTGSSALKALLYMDEIYGYFPPTANPPSKKPMLLLLKQARAYGVGVLLATQNPVDLDYKGLSNIGTWFVGRLQTSQDQKRVLDGIVGASDGKLDRAEVKSLLSTMKSRQFLLTSAHLDTPLLFQTRWVMSFLKGPVSTSDIKILMAERKKQLQTAEPDSNTTADDVQSADTQSSPRPDQTAGMVKPPLPTSISQLYKLNTRLSDTLLLRPSIGAEATVRYYNSSRNIDELEQLQLQLFIDENAFNPDWSYAEIAGCSLSTCSQSVPEGAGYHPLPNNFQQLKTFKTLEKDFADYLYQNKKLSLYRAKNGNKTLLESIPGEGEGDFLVRVHDILRNQKEVAVEKLEERYRAKQQKLEDSLDRAVARLDKEEQDVSGKTTDTLITFGVAVLGAFLGRKAASVSNIRRAASGMKGVGRIAKEKGDVARARDQVQEVEQAMEELSYELQEKVENLSEKYGEDSFDLETFAIKPRRSDIFDIRLALVWEAVEQ